MNISENILTLLHNHISLSPKDGYFAVTNPADNSVLAYVANQGVAQTEAAVTEAQNALAAWSGLTAKARAAILKKWNDLVLSLAEDLALLVSLEQGRALKEARGEVAYAASFLEWFAEEGKRAYGRTIPAGVAGKHLMTIKQAVGVCSAITPWNFPLSMITRKVAPALAAGCTVVIKPSEETPLCALILLALAHQAGIPKGVMHIITTLDAPAVGKVLTTHPAIKKFSFTGSTPVGKQLYAQCASTVKKVSLELGGNAPFTVFDDADMEAAIEGVLASKYRNSGQTCVCANRILVQAGIYDRFAAALAARVGAMRLDQGWHENTQLGPLINQKAVAKVKELVDDAVSQGAKIITGGKVDGLGDNFFQGSVITDVTPNMAIFSTEIFGPVAPLFMFSEEVEAIRLANNTPFGLAAYAFTRDVARCMRLARDLQYGMVGLNDGVMSTELAPFGGIKESGIGREGAAEGLEEYLVTKFISMGNLG
jgi:succinate-semialdehyde dehydrogenase/glutarate-semialdehyde dehydrogenase